MAIKINWQDLQKRIINGKEVERVMLNGVQIRPESNEPDYLYFEPATVDGCTIQLNRGWQYQATFEISYDKVTRQDYTPQLPNSEVINLNYWDRIYWRSKSETQTPLGTGRYNSYRFVIEWKTKAWWDVNYLLCKNWTNDLTDSWDYVFFWLFSLCRDLITPPKLSATTLTTWCYEEMFRRTWLTTKLPNLPATTLPDRCYNSMFMECSWVKLSDIEIGNYNIGFRIPTSWTWTQQWGPSVAYYMFYSTWWRFTGSPDINRRYYLSSQIPTPTYNPWIYENTSEWLITMSYDGINWITLANKDLWAINPWDRGYLYQRWNSHENPYATATDTIVWPVDTTWYWPWNYYESSHFVTSSGDWSSPSNNNLWWDVTDTRMARRWPCDNWFHVPTWWEYNFLMECLNNLWLTPLPTMMNMLYFVAWKYLNINGVSTSPWYNRRWYYWTSNPSTVLELLVGWPRLISRDNGRATPIRPFKDVYVLPDNTRTVLYQPS